MWLASKNRYESGDQILKILSLESEVQDLKMKLLVTLGELEALKADQEFEYLDTKAALLRTNLDKLIQSRSTAVVPVLESERQVKKSADLSALYQNQSPLFNFVSETSQPKTFIVEHKEVLCPRDLADHSSHKHNEAFKVLAADQTAFFRSISPPKDKPRTINPQIKSKVTEILDEVDRSIAAHKIVQDRRNNLKK